MIELTRGDIFQSNCEVLVNPVNCVGVSGKGLALEFKNKYPDNHLHYNGWCDNVKPKPGDIYDWRTGEMFPKYIFNLTTKNHWRDPSKLSWIDTGCFRLRKFCEELNIQSIACPPIGCGLGGLDWEEVRNTLINYFENYEGRLVIYGPY